MTSTMTSAPTLFLDYETHRGNRRTVPFVLAGAQPTFLRWSDNAPWICQPRRGHPVLDAFNAWYGGRRALTLPPADETHPESITNGMLARAPGEGTTFSAAALDWNVSTRTLPAGLGLVSAGALGCSPAR